MSQGTAADRQLFVSGDIRSIPFGELRPMCSNVFEWLVAGVLFKLFRMPAPLQFATESRRLLSVNAEQVPKRLMNYFDGLRPQAEPLGYQINHYATIPAVGPIAIALMTMSEPAGQSCFYAVRVALKVNDSITDDGHFGFNSCLADDELLSTITYAKLPKPRPGMDRKIIKTTDVNALHKEHRNRMMGKRITPVHPSQWFAIAEKHNRLETDDLLQRRVTRLATPGEVARIRSQTG
ncbi:hypothetical protein [Stieleria varia]|uniref:Uncharacterized protein n=1 Tax=Stieleria varia TaxID=2528005 RepID=A0A5C6AZJ5_9BACT|nr:hypothetical protein [Stieleria varia]TWU04446.1 hypothetical protein Pla52n_24870 [Stieleria varia]